MPKNSCSRRCQCKNVTNNLICKNKSNNLYTLFNKKYCSYHYSYYTKRYAINIQKIFRGNKTRKNIKNIYMNLPDDIQRKIVYYIREQHYYNKYKNVMRKIVYNKLSKFEYFMNHSEGMQYSDYALSRYNELLISYITFIYENLNYIETNYDLYLKYRDIFRLSTESRFIALEESDKIHPYNLLQMSLYYHKDKINFNIQKFEHLTFNAYTKNMYKVVKKFSDKLNNTPNYVSIFYLDKEYVLFS